MVAVGVVRVNQSKEQIKLQIPDYIIYIILYGVIFLTSDMYNHGVLYITYVILYYIIIYIILYIILYHIIIYYIEYSL